jgi:hypothetical protein
LPLLFHEEVKPEMTMEPRYLTTKEAARYVTTKYGVSCSPNTLAKIRSTGGSPAYHPIGRRVYYLPHELEAWSENRVGYCRTSTSDQPYVDDEAPDLDDQWRTGDPAFDEITRLENEAFDDLDAAIKNTPAPIWD